MSIRSEKVASEIKKALVKPVSDLVSELYHGALVTVTSVRLTRDLRLAYVYLSFYGNNISPGEFIEILENKKSSIRAHIGSSVRLRFVPDLKFFVDDTLDQMEHIQDLLDSVNKKNNNENENEDDKDNNDFDLFK